MPDNSESPCPDCLAAQGLCRSCEHLVLPQLAKNLGWLRLMGEARVEQTKRQSKPRPADAAAIAKAKRREARKHSRRGIAGLLTHIRTAA